MTRTEIRTRRATCLTWFAAGLMAVGVAGLTGCNKDETGKTPGEKAGEAVKTGVDSTTKAAGNAADATGKAAKDAKDAVVAGVAPSGTSKVEDTRSTVEKIVEKAGKRNDWSGLADAFTKTDADRVKNGWPDSKDLDDLADKIATNWNNKYGEKYSVMNADKVFAPDFLKLTTDPSGTKDSPKATGTIPASHGMPELTLNFVGEGGKWRLDIPDGVDAQKLHDNLKSALTDLQDSSKWDADKVQATRAVAHRMLLAVMDKAGSGTASAE